MAAALAVATGAVWNAAWAQAPKQAAGKVAALPGCQSHRVVAVHGDNVYSMLRKAGIGADQVMRWLQRPEQARRLHALRAGDALVFCAARAADGHEALASLAVEYGKDRRGGAPRPAPAGGSPVREAFVVHSTLDAALRARHVPEHLIGAVRSYLHNDADLPARLPRGTRVAATFSTPPSRAGARLLCLDVELRGRRHRIFHYVDAEGRQYLLSDHGHGVRILAMERPLPHARISSGWGWRINPVLKRREFHKGIDYAAPLGTPIRAAMDGVVRLAEWHGNYGRMVDIRNAAGIDTRYGHMLRFAKGIRPGAPVRAGQVIGYVGASGLATGPHLYFELWDGLRRIDPLVRTPVVEARLGGEARQRFVAFVQQLQVPSSG